MIVRTESLTVYEFDHEACKVRRLPHYEGAEMRRDSEWVGFTGMSKPVIGERMVIMLEPLDPAAVATRRTTTPRRCNRHLSAWWTSWRSDESELY